jgi:hypothetical protein
MGYALSEFRLRRRAKQELDGIVAGMAYRRHCEEPCDEATQSLSAEGFWIASLRSQ